MSVHYEVVASSSSTRRRMRTLPVIEGFSVLCILFNVFTCSDNQAIQIHLEPSGVLYVCTGNPFKITCGVDMQSVMGTSSYIWNITVPSEDYPHRQRVFIPTNNSMIQPLELSLSTLNFSSRAFPQRVLSTVFTGNATALNGTVLTCSWLLVSNTSVSVSDSVQLVIVGGDTGNVNITPKVNISERFETNSVTLYLEWSTKNGASYSVSVDPTKFVNYTGKDSAQLTVSYNIMYNVSVSALLCGENGTTFSAQKYVRCQQAESPDQNIIIQVLNHRNIPIEGTTITLSCPIDLVLTGSSSSTCTENGTWDLDFKESRCKADCGTPVVDSNINLTYNSTLEDSLLTFKCNDGLLPDAVFTATCYRNKSWIPNPSNHICVNSSAANCGDPPPPSSGYIVPYTSTTEGTTVQVVLKCASGGEVVNEILCTSQGEWAPVNGSTSSCTMADPKDSHTFAVIGGSLGSCLGLILICCAIVIATIIVIKKRTSQGTSQREIPSRHKILNCCYHQRENLESNKELQKDNDQTFDLKGNEAYGSVTHYIQTEGNVAYAQVNLRNYVTNN